MYIFWNKILLNIFVYTKLFHIYRVNIFVDGLFWEKCKW